MNIETTNHDKITAVICSLPFVPVRCMPPIRDSIDAQHAYPECSTLFCILFKNGRCHHPFAVMSCGLQSKLASLGKKFELKLKSEQGTCMDMILGGSGMTKKTLTELQNLIPSLGTDALDFGASPICLHHYEHAFIPYNQVTCYHHCSRLRCVHFVDRGSVRVITCADHRICLFLVTRVKRCH